MQGCTPAQLALAWVLAQGDDVIPIPGATSAKTPSTVPLIYLSAYCQALSTSCLAQRLYCCSWLIPGMEQQLNLDFYGTRNQAPQVPGRQYGGFGRPADGRRGRTAERRHPRSGERMFCCTLCGIMHLRICAWVWIFILTNGVANFKAEGHLP